MGNDRRRDLLRLMMLGRATEDAIASVFGHYHPARGEEGVCVGAFAALEEADVALPHYRGAVIASLTRGASPRELIAGLLGKATGPTRGRQRGDFVGKFTPNFFGNFSGTLGPSIGYATGAALAATLDGTMVGTVVTFGDGTSNSGLLYESLNMASMLTLPVVFVCQNNQFAISMPAARSIAGGSPAKRAAAFGIRALDVDGNDVVAVHDAVRDALARARRGEGPTFIHALTYRVSGHWANDPCPYRDPAETERWRRRDPVERLAGTLVAEGSLTTDVVAAMQEEASATARAALETAQGDPWPDPSVIAQRHAYAG